MKQILQARSFVTQFGNLILKLMCLCYFLSVACLADNEQIKVTPSSVSRLLQQPTVSTIYRDIEGVLWIGTQQGLYRHNGAAITEFNTDKSDNLWIPESAIKDIGGDSKGNLFVATSGGILLVWDRQLQKFTYRMGSESTENSRLVRMLVSKAGDVWLLHQLGLSIYNAKLGSEAKRIEGLKINEIVGIPQAIAEDERGNLWVGGSKGIAHVEIQEKSFSVSKTSNLDLPKDTGITVIAIDRENNLRIGTNSGQILTWDASKNIEIASLRLPGSNRIYVSNIVLTKNRLVIGTDSGLYISDEKLTLVEEVQASGESRKAEDIYSLLVDEKYVWVGKINGLDILTFAPFQLFDLKNSGVSDHALAFAQDNNDDLWVGTYSGLYLYNPENRKHIRSDLISDKDPMTADDQRVVALAQDSDDLWVGLFEGGAMKLDISSGDSYKPKLDGENQVAVTKIVIVGNDVWIATFDHGLFRIQSNKYHSYIKNRGLTESSVNSLFRSSTGFVLAVSGSRVHKYDIDSDKFQELPLDFGNSTHNPDVYAIAEAKTNDIFFGTKDYGVFVWSRSDQTSGRFNLSPASTDSGLKASTIYAIEIDTDGNLWCSTQHGVVKISPQGTLLKRFTTADGLQGNDFTLGASFKSRQGIIYFGGTNGYNRFDPKEIEIESDPSPMRLTAVSLPSLDSRDIGDVSDLDSLELTYVDRFVTLQFGVLDFIDPERNQFRYKLENFDSEWIENGNGNTATYTNLPAGNYVFRAQGANSSGIWNLEGIKIDVTVLPAPWRTWWAYTLYASALLCLVWGLIRIYRSYAIDRESALLALEMFETENKADDNMHEQLEFQDELVRSAYQHNLTTLGLVNDTIQLRCSAQQEDTSSDLAKHTMDRISALVGLEHCLSYHAGGSVVNLFQYTENLLPELLERAPVSPDTIVSVNEVTSLPIPAELAAPMSIVIFELIENCIQHAFIKNSPANYILIRLTPGSRKEPFARCYELTVHDSGIGITESIESLACKGRGLAIVQLIAAKLHGELEITREGGTTIRFLVPDVDV